MNKRDGMLGGETLPVHLPRVHTVTDNLKNCQPLMQRRERSRLGLAVFAVNGKHMNWSLPLPLRYAHLQIQQDAPNQIPH